MVFIAQLWHGKRNDHRNGMLASLTNLKFNQNFILQIDTWVKGVTRDLDIVIWVDNVAVRAIGEAVQFD